MNKAGRILSFNPPYAIPGGEVLIECEGFTVAGVGEYGCFFGGQTILFIQISFTSRFH